MHYFPEYGLFVKTFSKPQLSASAYRHFNRAVLAFLLKLCYTFPKTNPEEPP